MTLLPENIEMVLVLNKDFSKKKHMDGPVGISMSLNTTAARVEKDEQRKRPKSPKNGTSVTIARKI